MATPKRSRNTFAKKGAGLGREKPPKKGKDRAATRLLLAHLAHQDAARAGMHAAAAGLSSLETPRDSHEFNGLQQPSDLVKVEK